MLHNNTKGVRQSFSALTRFQTSATVAQTVVSPTASSSFFGAQVANMANLYNEFRLEKLRVRIFPTQTQDSGVGSSNTIWVMGYAPQVAASAPTTATDVAELSDVAAITSGMSVPAEFKLTRNSLIGPAALKWYHQGGSTNDTKFQGAIYFVALGTYSATWELCMIVQSTWSFRSPVPFGEFLYTRKSLGPVVVTSTIAEDPENKITESGSVADEHPTDDDEEDFKGMIAAEARNSAAVCSKEVPRRPKRKPPG